MNKPALTLALFLAATPALAQPVPDDCYDLARFARDAAKARDDGVSILELRPLVSDNPAYSFTLDTVYNQYDASPHRLESHFFLACKIALSE